MRIQAKLTGAAQVRGRYAALSMRAHNLEPGLLRAAMVPLAAAQGRIDAGGPGWPPTEETATGSPLHRTGALIRSLTVGGPDNEFEQIAGGVRVGTNLRTPGGEYNVGMLMQYGTGPILPKKGKFLVFEVNGQRIFSKGTRGIPARRFLYWDATSAQQAANIVVNFVKGGTPA